MHSTFGKVQGDIVTRSRLRVAAASAYHRAADFSRVALAMLCYPLIVLLRPLVLVRFYSMPVRRFGHFAYRISYYLAERELGIQPRRSFDVFSFRPRVPCNLQLARIARRALHVWQFTSAFPRIYSGLPGGKRHVIEIRTERKHGDIDIEGVSDRTGPHVALLPEEQERGWAILESRGIPRGSRFVCFHARTSDYLRQQFAGTPRGGDGKHDFRNSDIQSYVPAMERLADRGYYCFRLGAVVDKTIETKSSRVVDYANEFRSDFLDVFLIANCHFLVSNGSGPDSVADLFRRPVVFTNQAAVEYVHSWLYNLSIFKKLWLPAEGRNMTFREIIESGVGRYLTRPQTLSVKDFYNNLIEF